MGFGSFVCFYPIANYQFKIYLQINRLEGILHHQIEMRERFLQESTATTSKLKKAGEKKILNQQHTNIDYGFSLKGK